jgi:hypothetical protein
MHFLIGLAIVLGIIYGMIVSPQFRVASLIVIGAARPAVVDGGRRSIRMEAGRA